MRQRAARLRPAAWPFHLAVRANRLAAAKVVGLPYFQAQSGNGHAERQMPDGTQHATAGRQVDRYHRETEQDGRPPVSDLGP